MKRMDTYAQDSLFTLDSGGIAGVLILASILTALVIAVTWGVSRKQVLPIRLLVAAVVFAGFEWLSPQVFYEFYKTIIDGLPTQWVIRLPTLQGLLDLITFRGHPSLSSHGRGGLFWVLMIVALLAGRRFRRDAAN